MLMNKVFVINEKTKLFAFDLDGTLYLGEDILPGATELVDYLVDKYQVVFFTNNSSKQLGDIYSKLNRIGIKCNPEQVYSSGHLTALYLKETGIDNLYVIGSKGLSSEIKKMGLRIIDDDSAENIVVGLDLDFNYKKIETALAILLKGGKFIACNEDMNFPIGKHRFMPGCGSMVAAVSSASARRPDFVVGKPNTYILAKILQDFKVKRSEVIVVGDSYESDIEMALNYNCKGVLVNSSSKIINNDILVTKNLKSLLKNLKGVLK